MTDQEHVDCIEYAVKRVNGRVPVIAGAGSNHTSYAVWMSKEAKRVGADALAPRHSILQQNFSDRSHPPL